MSSQRESHTACTGEGMPRARRSAEAPGPVDAGLEEALVASKLDHLAAEYSALLMSQLDAQRAYFEGLLARQAGEAEASAGDARGAAERGAALADKARAEAAQAERAGRAAERKLVRCERRGPGSDGCGTQRAAAARGARRARRRGSWRRRARSATS